MSALCLNFLAKCSSLSSLISSAKPFFEAFFGAQKTVPGSLNIGDHFSLRWHVCGSVGKPQFSLQRVEVSFQFGFLFNTRWFVFASVFAIFFQFLLNGNQGISTLRLSNQGKVRRIHSKRSLANLSYSSIRRSLSWLTLRTLQIRLAAISACIAPWKAW